MKQPREFEVKLAVAPRDVDRVIAHPLLDAASAARHVDRLTATYFDTPEGTLHRHRISLRVRHSDSGATQTLKTSGVSRVDRHEWEIATHRVTTIPDRDWLRRIPLRRRLLGNKVLARLRPCCTTAVTRTRFPVSFEGAVIEAAVDQGVVRAGADHVPVHELELELKMGASKGVIALARRLAADLPLTLSLTSKAERGFRSATRTADQPTKALDLKLSRNMTVARAFEAITQSCLHALLFNSALIAGPERAEATHKARIALRRLRAAFNLFKPTLRRNRLAAIADSVKWISDRLGEARDADVFQTGTFDRAAREATVPGAQALADVMREAQTQAHRRLSDALASARWRVLLIDLLAFSITGIRRKARTVGFRRFAQRRLTKGRRALVRQAQHLRAKTPDARHAVRKKAKMLRYDLDMFANDPRFIGSKGAYHRETKALATVQETLGSLHDEETVRLRLDALCRPQGQNASDALSPQALAAAEILAGQPIVAGTLLDRADKAIRRLAPVSQ